MCYNRVVELFLTFCCSFDFVNVEEVLHSGFLQLNMLLNFPVSPAFIIMNFMLNISCIH